MTLRIEGRRRGYRNQISICVLHCLGFVIRYVYVLRKCKGVNPGPGLGLRYTVLITKIYSIAKMKKEKPLLLIRSS